MLRERTIETLEARRTALESDRTSWEAGWLAIQEHILPRRGRFLRDRARQQANRGERRGTNMLDNTALVANDRSAAGLSSGLSSEARPWVRDRVFGRDDLSQETEEFLDSLTSFKMAIFKACGLYDALYTMYLEAMGFGTAAGIIYPDFDNIMRIHMLTIGEYAIGTDHRSDVVELVYSSEMDVQQILADFSPDDPTGAELPQAIRTEIENSRLGTQFTVHCWIGKNASKSGGPGQRDMPWVSEYWIPGSQSGGHAAAFVARRGFSYKPIFAVRPQRIGRDAYGRGAGHNALADASMLQQLQRLKLRAIEYQVSPPLHGPAWLNDRETDLRPGAYNAKIAGQDQKIESMFQVQLRLDHLQVEIEATQERIREAFYTDVLAAFLFRQPTNITATEANEISQEKLTLFAPIASAFIRDGLVVINEAALQLIIEAGAMEPGGVLGEPPEEIAGQAEFDFEFVGVLAQAQKLIESGTIERGVAFALNYASAKPQALEELDDRGILDAYFDAISMPAKALRDRAEVARDRQAAAEAMEAERQMTAGREAAAAARDLGAADVTPDNALGQIVKGMEQAA